MIDFFSYDLSYLEFSVFFVCALSIGMAKTGIHGVGMAAVPLLALIFGGRESTGIALPMLICADIFAVCYYHRHADWSLLWKLFPWAAGGIVIGTVFGSAINDELFRQAMGLIIFISLGVMVWMEKQDRDAIPSNRWFTPLMGLLGGFTTMVGNLAGPIMALYLLSARLPKNAYIGTAAWFFMAVNVFKVPFHVFAWKTITPESLAINLLAVPLIAAGAFLGIWLVKKIADLHYRWFIIATTALAALAMLF